MAFSFEVRSSRSVCSTDSVTYPAFRVSVHKDSDIKETTKKLYFSFNQQAVKLARWVKGDRATVGFDSVTGAIGFVRDNENGYSLSGGGLTKKRGFAAFTICLSLDNPITVFCVNRIGQWVPLIEDGTILVADISGTRRNTTRHDKT